MDTIEETGIDARFEEITAQFKGEQPIMDGPQCTVCKGKQEVPKTGGGTITCPNCNGTGEERGDPRD